MKAILALEDGTIFEGKAFGATSSGHGEVCFNTSMTGYQEILTDPSYKNQMVTMTYPEIGNYGINQEDVESKQVQVSGFIIKNLCTTPSNWRNSTDSQGKLITLEQYLIKNNIPGICGIDTRKLVRTLREKGSLSGVILSGEYTREEAIAKAKSVNSLVGRDLAKEVTTDSQYNWTEGDSPLRYKLAAVEEKDIQITVLDFGVKFNILRRLRALGVKVTVLPASSTFEEVLATSPDGVLLSNGPGDPEPVQYAIETIKGLLGKVPLFGICLGHQLLSLALGAQTYKLKFGHRGANHPIKNLKTGEVAITSQNHGFAVELGSLNEDEVEVTHLNLNDNTVAGICHKKFSAFSVQYHPEASPGPKDSEVLFQDFLDNVMKNKETTV